MPSSDEDFLEEDDVEVENSPDTSTRCFLHKYLETKNHWDFDSKSIKIALLNILRDWYWIRSLKDYKSLKKLLDENPIWISIPEKIDILWNETKIFIYRDNKILVTNEKKEEIWTIDKNWFNEPYYNYWQKVNIDLDIIFYA